MLLSSWGWGWRLSRSFLWASLGRQGGKTTLSACFPRASHQSGPRAAHAVTLRHSVGSSSFNGLSTQGGFAFLSVCMRKQMKPNRTSKAINMMKRFPITSSRSKRKCVYEKNIRTFLKKTFLRLPASSVCHKSSVPSASFSKRVCWQALLLPPVLDRFYHLQTSGGGSCWNANFPPVSR